MRRSLLGLVVTFLIVSAVAIDCYGGVDLPMPRQYVADYANVIDGPEENSLNGVLQELEQKTGVQYIILTVESTEGVVVALGVIVLLGVGIFGWYIGGYNRAVGYDEGAKTAWSNVDAVLQRRLDLIPNLVSTIKGYAAHEKELFENIAKSREKYFQADSRGGKIEASNQMSGFLSRLLLLQERYPELKANQNFLALQDSLEGTENRIAVARKRYNDAAKLLNSYSREFFGSFFCRRAGVEKVEYFEASEQAKGEVPQVTF